MSHERQMKWLNDKRIIYRKDPVNDVPTISTKEYNYSDLKCILENIHKYMGQRATFTYFERTKAGSYRHPLFKAIRDYK